MLGGECFNGDSVRNGGNDISDIVRLQEAVDGRSELVKAGLLPPCRFGYRLNFWERG